MNIWQAKPWWCQPWSIVLTGVLIISGSWVLLHRIWITALVALPILGWMGFFLLIYPKLMLEYLQSQQSIQSGISDGQPD